MAKSTHPITYHYDFEHNGSTHDIAITRRHTGTAYARNGNVGNPTEYFRWEAVVNGVTVAGLAFRDRTDAYENARAKVLGIPYRFDLERPARCCNVRSWVVVRDEMKANYRRREAEPAPTATRGRGA